MLTQTENTQVGPCLVWACLQSLLFLLLCGNASNNITWPFWMNRKHGLSVCTWSHTTKCYARFHRQQTVQVAEHGEKLPRPLTAVHLQQVQYIQCNVVHTGSVSTKKGILSGIIFYQMWPTNFRIRVFHAEGPSRLGVPGPRLERMMESGRLSSSSVGESMNLNASIRERLRSKVRGKQVCSGETKRVAL